MKQKYVFSTVKSLLSNLFLSNVLKSFVFIYFDTKYNDSSPILPVNHFANISASNGRVPTNNSNSVLRSGCGGLSNYESAQASGVNNLNQFIQAEKITKDLNPTYGSIQKLYGRDTDILALCEDKVLKILANKDALFNADGNMNVTSNNAVLGQAVPFVGDYGISTNPESFAADEFRCYFADRQRGAVVRLSRDGLTNIAEHGMEDYFSDNLTFAKTSICLLYTSPSPRD